MILAIEQAFVYEGITTKVKVGQPTFTYLVNSRDPRVYTYTVFFSKMKTRYNLLLVGGTNMLDITQIKEIIPHRYPFLLIDKILEVEEGQKAVGIKNVTANEEFFNGHFPDYPVMPGVLIVEALAQVGAVAMLIKEENRGRLAFFGGIDKCRFKRQVVPGDQLRLEVEIIRVKGPVGKGKAVATVDGELVCEAEITFALK
jgi:3-hydroxyacyl-[acyl-carrier-protein] dehydratase